MKYRLTTPRWLPSVRDNGRIVLHAIYTVVEFHEGDWLRLEDFTTQVRLDCAGWDLHTRLHDCIQRHCTLLQERQWTGESLDPRQAEKAGKVVTSLARLNQRKWVYTDGGVLV